MKRFTFFQIATIGVFLVFMGIMVVVAITAFTRQSGSTGLNMAKIQKMRYEVSAKRQKNSDNSELR